MFKEFKEFAIKGSAIDLAVGVIIGAAFTTIVNSIVNDLFNPIISLITGRVDLSNWTIGLPGDPAIRIGSFVNASINFVIVAFVVFLVVKQINRFRKPGEAKMRECPFCKSEIAVKASRCPHCTSSLAN